MEPIVLVSTLILVFPIAMIIAALTDLFTFRIPNKVSIVLAATFVVWAWAVGMSLGTFGLHVLTGFAVLFVGIVLNELKALGGGDAKLMAAGSLWVGHLGVLSFMITITLIGACFIILLLSYRAIVPPPFLARHAWAMRLHEKNGKVPYGVAIAIAGLLMFPKIWMQGVGA